jgi:proteasome lid subunit RPN8/RPN11
MTLFWTKHVESAAWFCPDKECVVSIVLDTLFQVKAFHLVAIGSVNQVLFEPREILRPAVAVSEANCVVLHNHPSGDATPSNDDILITWRLIRAGQILGVTIVDHVIIGENCHYSFRENQPDLFGSERTTICVLRGAALPVGRLESAIGVWVCRVSRVDGTRNSPPDIYASRVRRNKTVDL